MRFIYLTVFALVKFSLATAQVGKEYINREKTCAGGTYCYQMTKLVIHSDSTLNIIGYGCINKKEWRDFDKWNTETWQMKVIPTGKYQQLIEVSLAVNSENYSHIVKIKHKKVLFFDKNFETNRYKKIAKYKRYVKK